MARRHLIARVLGKRFIYTDRQNWPDEQIIQAFRSRQHVESAFRWMKAPAGVPFGPMYPWNDTQICVHAIVCVLAMTLATLVRREMWSVNVCCGMTRALRLLRGTKEVTLVRTGQRKGFRKTTTQLSHEQRILWKHWNMARWVSPKP